MTFYLRSVIAFAAWMPVGWLAMPLSAGEAEPLNLVLEEFDGAAPNGRWEIHQYPGTFEYHVRPGELVMVDKENKNQHLTRRGLTLDPTKRYALQTLFTINEPEGARPPNSFCLNFNIAGPEGSLESISCWSVNLTVQPVDGARGMMFYMGFVDGKFQNIGRRTFDWCRMGTEYSFRVDVNSDLAGRTKLKTVTVTLKEGETVRERFEIDYSPFPYQPDLTQPVRVGVNSHGADWTMRQFKVYAEE
jgi:hypothetical protein